MATLTPRRRRPRARVLLALMVIVLALGWVGVRGLTGALVYYRTPTDIVVNGQGKVGDRERLGGLVQPGSVAASGSTIRFVVGDGTNRLSVIATGGVPSLFKAGQGVVVEGAMAADGAFHADTVLVKHSGVYRPPAPGTVPRSADLSKTG